MPRSGALAVVVLLAVAACGRGDDADPGQSAPETTNETAPSSPTPVGAAPETTNAVTSATVVATDFGDAPTTPDGPNDEATEQFEAIVASIEAADVTATDIDQFVEVGDARHAWLVSDLMRFFPADATGDALVKGFAALTGADIRDADEPDRSAWNGVTNRLIAWDTPAPPDYQRLKGELYTLVEPGWVPFFDDPDATIDWRWLSWGGVFIDDRALDDPEPCDGRGCIPALDDPTLVSADEGDWYDDDALVFGVTEGDEAVAFPKNIMEVHEMVNITIGGRRFGIPYCTLCGSAQAFYTDEVPDGVETPVLRTSGLLSRSNKVMYDLNTSSAFDTFTGAAVSGRLLDAGVVLDQNSVTVSTWGDWKADHPDTMIVAEDGGIGRTYSDDPLRGRDDDGPIFPIGDADPRLGMQAPVIGVVLDDGTSIAFDVDALDRTVEEGDTVSFEGVTIERDGSGFVATIDDEVVGSHQAFWFAWSQFHADTLLWPADA